MNNNDILRRLRYTFDLSNADAIALFSKNPISVAAMDQNGFQARLLKQEEDGYEVCTDQELNAFLDGLIVSRRGLKEPPPNAKPLPADFRLSRNDILKKLRIAMNFRDEDMLATLAAGGSKLSKSELGAFFRKPDHKHYRACGNQVLRNFIAGLTQQLRG